MLRYFLIFAKMTIPVGFITRYAIPLVVATLFLGDVDIPQQINIFDKTQRLSDEVLSKAMGEGEGPPESFDYIIVGAGSAGAILANRLTASGENRVLLLEAGGSPNPIMDVPNAQRFFWNSEMNWNYTTVKQSRSCGATDGYCAWPRGKALGGSSSVNGLLYNRAKPKDYDLWANFTGDQSWSWANIKDTYNSIEDYHGYYEESAGANHGYGGEMYVGQLDYLPGVEVFEEALKEKGIPTGDLNGGEDFTYGFTKIDHNIKNGLRWGTYQAFLEPILNRTNLVIYRYAYAIRVETESLGNGTHRAVGVTYERHGAIRTVLAEKEVIISGGVVESPKLLMLSGIGPRERLEELNITRILDLPVGNYLQDHPGVDITGSSGGFRLNTTFGKDLNSYDTILQFIQNGTGPRNGFAYDGGYAPQIMRGYLSSSQNQDDEWPDVHIYIRERYRPSPDEQEEVYFAVDIIRPVSTGTIKLASKDPNDKPIIDPNFYSHQNDMEKVIDVIEIMMDVFMNSTTYQKYGIQQLDVYEPCRGEEFLSRNYWSCMIQERTTPYYHPTSTCRIGPDPSIAVLDSKLNKFFISAKMTIPVGFITRYAIPLVVATLFLGDVDIPEQINIFYKTQRLSDEVLSKARGEGEGPPESFDYIIVGGGSAGAILANRLTASGENRVLLLEAGGDPSPILDIPYAQRYFGNSEMNWGYTTVKQERACGATDGHCFWPRGKALGGSSSVNALVYNRCKPKDYDLWANFTGDQSWSWANIKDAYNRIEDYHGFYEESAGANHGYGGEMYVGQVDYLPGVEVFEEALKEKGIPTGDLNGGEDFTYGFTKLDYNIKNGLRWGTYQAFLEPILNRTNLVIYRYAYAIRVETESLGNGTYKAVGVTYERHGAIRTVLAEKEVIVSGGSIESPKLLMLSGIGPREHLEEMNITTILDLPVGKYLQDHPGVDVKGNNGGFRLNTTFGKDLNSYETILQYVQNGTGPRNGFAYDGGFAPMVMRGYLTSSQSEDKEWPDVHVYIRERYKPAPDEQEEVSFGVDIQRPNSSGTIKLASNDPKEKPIIDPNFYGDLNDMELVIDGIEIMMDVFMNSTTYQKYGIQQLDVLDACQGEEFLSRDYWRCMIREKSTTYFHPTSNR
ncbi:Alcohol dehydrogenase [acceptor] [Orchesella cincta]|uniref:Alcohol dehydrogenase [acceptor] n=1 Tax=Orchesella cincta TaxID=48709 RepID=A0A1D2M4V3_ORCCI|nr:Alcohol dehydrogenase [acceptor] [Orchesella cincta]